MINYTDFLLMEEKRQVYEYGCAMVFFQTPEFIDLQKRIEEKDIHENGLETEPHVTLLYGIHSKDVEDHKVLDICCNKAYQPIQLHNVSLFENDNYDVLKFDAKSSDLQEINRNLVESVPYTNDYPDYHPHATIAYLKPGTGKKYTQLFEGAEVYVIPEKIVYSKPDGSKLEKKLNN